MLQGMLRPLYRATVVVSAVAITFGFASTASAATKASAISLSPITAKFVPSEFATHYTIQARDLAGRPLRYSWKLSLQLVDKSGAANPTLPGSAAALDKGCTNHGKLTSTAMAFVWQHGDASLGNCDHSKMGPSGHQGRISLVVSDGQWACTTHYDGTNDGIGPAAVCAALVPKVTTSSATATSYKCTGAQIKLFDNTNGGGVSNGATGPTFSTKGAAYCLTEIVTYHWNNGQGATPGTLGLSSGGKTVGPFAAKGSAGQNNAPNVNWTASVSTSPKPRVLNGTYACVDSAPASWSQDAQTGGKGFCMVYVTKAVPAGGATVATTGTKKTGTAAKPAKSNATATPKCKAGKLGIAAAPDTGKPPLAVTFALCSPKVVQWRIDYGDGSSKVAIGSPPKTIAHTYQRAGYFRAVLRTINAANAASASSATASISVQTAQLVSLGANPAAGPSPLRVTFALGTTAQNVAKWTLDFGDGQHTGGPGKPPAAVVHTYAHDGTDRATFSVNVGANALVYTVAQITVGNGTPPVLGVTASPSSGRHPLAVTFHVVLNIPGRIVSWVMVFGDGTRQSGSGTPPSSLSHTYAKKGLYGAYLQVSQQQQYGGVLYVVPRGGLAISVN